jgi:hypothetical protein
MIDLELACRARDDISLISFDDILQRAPEETRCSPVPARWSVVIRPFGGRGTVYLAPDAIFGLRLQAADGSSRTSYVFVEIDRGTMTIAPAERVRESDAFVHRATILRKLVAYAESWRQERHKAHFGVPAPRMLMLTTSAARAQAMQRAAYELVAKVHKMPPGAFLFGAQGGDGGPLQMDLIDSAACPVRLVP